MRSGFISNIGGVATVPVSIANRFLVWSEEPQIERQVLMIVGGLNIQKLAAETLLKYFCLFFCNSYMLNESII